MIGSDEGDSTFENKFANDDKVWVKMRGVPFRVEEDEIYDFFAGLDFIEGSIIIGVRADGKRTGQAVVLFINEDAAQKAIDLKNGNTIGERWIELTLHDFKFYQGFYDMGMLVKENTIGSMLKDSKNKDKAVRLRGLPFQSTKENVLEFMAAFAPKEENIHFEVRNGKFSGRAVVFLDSEEQACDAAIELNKKYIGNRYIEVDACCKISELY